MNQCTVLGDATVRDLLISLSKDEILQFAEKLGDCLRSFSAEKERQYQPAPSTIRRPDGQKVLFRPFTSPESVGTKIIIDPAPVQGNDENGKPTARKLPLHGVLVLCDKIGIPTGLINAEEVTGFRTSLSALLLFVQRRHVESIVVFGAGKQALWHIRLALALRGDEVKSVVVINRSKQRAEALASQIREENSLRWKSAVTVSVLHTSDPRFKGDLRSRLSEADAVFCTVPSQEPLFAKSDLTPRRDRFPYISAIGSWQPDMIELDTDLVDSVVSDSTAFNPKDGATEGIIVVDDRESTLSDAGEIVQSKLREEHLLEIGEALSMQQQAKASGKPHEKLDEWLAQGFVVYKSVGVGLTDLAAGEAILELAKQRQVGQALADF